MRTVLARAAVLAAALLVVLPMAASAAVDDYAAEASTTSVRLSLFEEAVGSPVLELVNTDALAASDPMASASVQAIEVMGTELIPVRTAESSGSQARDPEEGEGCAAPEMSGGLTLRFVCAVALADAGGPGEVKASATTELLNIGVNGSLVAGLLTSPLSEFVGTLTDGATADAISMFTAACTTLLEELPDEANEVPNTVGELVGMLPEELEPAKATAGELIDQLGEPNACSAILKLTVNDVVAPIIDGDAIAAALDGVSLVELSVDGASSDIAGGDEAVKSTATQALVGLTGPGLGEIDLPGIISGLLNGVETDLQTAIEDTAGVDLPAELDITDAVQQIVDALPEFGTEPLIEATISGGAATATLERSDASTTSGGTEPFVELAIAGGIMELFGQDPESGTVTLAAGESQTFGDGTPLASTIEVGALTTSDDAEFEGLPGSTARASATTFDLFNGEELMGGIELVLSESTAGAYGTGPTPAAPSPDPDPDPMPHTGGGAAVAAVLALGAGVALRRRRD